MTIRPIATHQVTWTDTADVVVVGFGAAGSAAAIDARAAGADVLIVERAGAAGGAAALSDGFVYLGGGTPEQQQAGFTDSVENMRAFLRAATGPAPDLAKVDLYCERSLEHREWLLAQGVSFVGTHFPDRNGTSPVPGEGLMYTGGENAWPYDELATPAPRGHVVQGGKQGGKALMDRLSAAALAAGARTCYDTRVERLVVDGDRVVGVAGTRFGEPFAARATGGVVLAAGGFIFNPAMVEQYAPAVHATELRLGTEGDDGSGIRMAQGVGAQVKRMDAIECALPFNAPRSLVQGIIVNRFGQRFINEDTYMGRVGQTALVQQGGQAYLVVDEEHYAPHWLGYTATWVCESADELGAEIGLPAGALAATIDYFNEHAKNGDDPQFGKRTPMLTPLVGALAAFDLRADKFIYAPFTLGGLLTRTTGEVLDLDGEPIPGLFAAGRTTSGVSAQGYCSGLSLGDSTLFGRLAGQSAAQNAASPLTRSNPTSSDDRTRGEGA